MTRDSETPYNPTTRYPSVLNPRWKRRRDTASRDFLPAGRQVSFLNPQDIGILIKESEDFQSSELQCKRMVGPLRLLHAARIIVIALILPMIFIRTNLTPPAYALDFGTPVNFLFEVTMQRSLTVASSASFLKDVHFSEPAAFLNELTAHAAAVFENTLRVLGETVFEGNVTHQSQALFQGNVVLPKNMAGTITVPARSTRYAVVFTQPFDTTPVVTVTQYLANATSRNVSLSSYVFPFVTDVSPTGFTVILNRSISIPLLYNWIAIAVSE